MSAESFKRKLTAILSADVKGYSRLMGENEAETVKTLTSYRKIMGELIQQHRGRVIDSPGDNILAEFASVVDAVQCSVAAQNEFKARNAELPENRHMEFRIGVNLGDVIEEENRIYGDGVNIAARLEGLADPGGICISKTAFDQIETKLPLGYEYLGDQTVKNIAKPIGAYRVLMEPRVTVVGAKEKKPSIRLWRGKGILVGAAAVLIAIIGVVVWNYYWRAPKLEPASKEKMAFPLPDKPSIAVLPFVNMSGDPQQEFLSDGITENIITGLSQIRALFIIARNSSFTYKGKPVKVQQVAENLGVRYVLEGSVKKSGDSLRITAQFIDALKGHHIWSERYDRELKDLFAIEDDITKKIITALQVVLTQGEQARLFAKGTENLDAYLKYMEAREYNFRFNKDANLVARQRAEEAISLDSKYSSAHAMLGKVYVAAVFFGWSASPKEALGRAFESAKKALALDESDSKAHEVLAFVHLLKREHDAAVEECERAVSLAPNAADTAYNLGIILRFAGRVKDAIPMFERAIRLNPIPPASYLYQLALSYTFIGEFEKAIDVCKEALSKNPDDLVGRVTLVIAYTSLGREGDARTQVSELLRIDPKFSLDQAAKTWPYKKEADREFVLAALRKAGLPDMPPLPLPDKPSIAVLPFVNMSDDPQQEFFGDGLAEEIINALAKLSQIFVIARNSSFTLKGKMVDLKQVGQELGVKYVMEGSVRRDAQRVRVTAQLIVAATGNHLFSERYDRELKDIFATQDEITIAVVRAVRVNLTSGEQARMTGRGTKNLDAYLKAIQANEQFNLFSRQGSVRAREFAKEAISLDPKYAFPYAVLANAHMLDVWFRFSESPEESMRLAEDASHTALALDKADPYVLSALANVYVMQRQYERAIVSAERALEISPGSARSQSTMATALLFACRFHEAIPFYEEAIRLDPYPPGLIFRLLGSAYSGIGRHDEALRVLQKALRVNPTDIFIHLGLAIVYVELGREEEAHAAAKEVLKLYPKFSLDYFAKALTFKDQSFVDRRIERLRKAGLK